MMNTDDDDDDVAFELLTEEKHRELLNFGFFALET